MSSADHINPDADTCMQKMFDAGYLLTRALDWLKSADAPPEVKGSAALIVGNLARSGELSGRGQ